MTTVVESPAELAMGRMASLVMENDRPWIESAADWQIEDAEAILDPDGPEKSHFITRPKGGRKTADVAAIVLAVLLDQAPPRARLYAAAADQEQAGLLVDSIAGYVERSGLHGLVKVTGDTVTNLQDGATFKTLAADAPGAQGLRPYFLALDELAEWRDSPLGRRLLQNLLQGTEKYGARVVVISNAGSPAGIAGRLYRTALASRHWRVSELAGPLPWLSESQLERLRETCDSEAEYLRLHANVWAEGPDRLASVDDIEACMVLPAYPAAPEYGQRYVIGVDLALKRDLAALVVAHNVWRTVRGETGWRQERRVIVDLVKTWKAPRGGSIDLVDVRNYLAGIARQYYGATAYLDAWQAAHMAADLNRSGVQAELVSATEASNQRSTMALLGLFQDRAIELPKDEDLARELASVSLKEVGPNKYKLGDARTDLGHHDRTSALALAVDALVDTDRNPSPRLVIGQRWAGGRR
jgi:hypothetical protein